LWSPATQRNTSRSLTTRKLTKLQKTDLTSLIAASKELYKPAQDLTKLCDASRSSTKCHDASQATTTRQHYTEIQPKKEGIDLKTIRHVSIRFVLGPEAKPVIFVEVVSPTDATGHPQLTSALRRWVTTDREGSRILYWYVRSALLRLTSTALESRDDAYEPVKPREQASLRVVTNNHERTC
jgi:hypothetical protein